MLGDLATDVTFKVFLKWEDLSTNYYCRNLCHGSYITYLIDSEIFIQIILGLFCFFQWISLTKLFHAILLQREWIRRSWIGAILMFFLVVFSDMLCEIILLSICGIVFFTFEVHVRVWNCWTLHLFEKDIRVNITGLFVVNISLMVTKLLVWRQNWRTQVANELIIHVKGDFMFS